MDIWVAGDVDMIAFAPNHKVEVNRIHFDSLLICHRNQGAIGTQMEDARGWWFSNPKEDSFNALDQVDTCKGLDESLETVSKAMVELGPFDGVIGFSQGAALVSMICTLKQKGDPRFYFDFAILIAGFKSRSKLHADFYKEPISLPSLHVFGDTDRVIAGEMSQELSTLFVDPVILTHPGGHFVPASAPQKQVYFQFLEKFQEKKAAA
ncbi:esterase OVCA2 isoform X1 [Callorhinchus milii]|uniref:esterase OVCA2 isoform X1 n=1 Tax=Callorhinchus milii TaxID=7868 RepID=UPI001C3F9643|nr:esterase OVCA2 isoform X1 [Callorhinchus milii]